VNNGKKPKKTDLERKKAKKLKAEGKKLAQFLLTNIPNSRRKLAHVYTP
jgi:hypothetical protein